MQWFFIELSIFIAIFVIYLSLVKQRIFLAYTNFYALNTRRIIFLSFIFLVLQITASFTYLLNLIFDNSFRLKIGSSLDDLQINLILFIFLTYLAIIYGLINLGIWQIKKHNLILPLHGWFLPFLLFICANHFGFFLVLQKVYPHSTSWQILFLIALCYFLIITSSYAFFYARKFFLKLNIDLGYRLSFVIGSLWLAFLV